MISTAGTVAPDEIQLDADEVVGRVRVEGLGKTFHRKGTGVEVLRDIDLDVAEGELLVLLGPSGCGKSTLLRCLVGLERPTRGRIELGNQAVVDTDRRVFVPPNKRDVGMVFQNYALWPHMTVSQNLAFPLKARRMKQELKSGRIEELLDTVQCGQLADRYPPELSGGQQQRVSLARALATRPTLLLLDEPLSNLDALLRLELRAQLRHLHRKLGFTAIHVTHDQEEAMSLGTRIAVMRAGRFDQIGTPDEVFRRPATEYVADFLGARNRLEMKADGRGGAQIAGSTLSGFVRQSLSGSFVLRLRDSGLTLHRPQQDDSAWVPHRLKGATVVEVLPAGDHIEHVIELGDLRLFAKMPAEQQSFSPGEKVDVGIDLARALCYDTDGMHVDDWAVASS